ncbi:heavy metal translocating P-type ATPase [Garciella nitratireducens]|uniref:Cd(2+)-exporting ATPase n=1 Tax=Garciella nitratireducens DSM 15102 TaxID=1121911 RepID=A0A1T4KQ65_9FIRM|nr:heavy metal translocating P-type ATPase [Garciella nitratireducens]SJZ44555.1 Cd2+/Zn2+-exporting ATPase [Garciella nitratireducens DSM 15102]
MKKRLWRLIIATCFFIIALMIDDQWEKFVLSIISYIIIGYDILIKAVKNIFKGKVFDENFLMGIATIGAMLIGEYPEGVAVMLFYQLGELFQSYAVDRSRKSIAALMDIRPDYANIKEGEEWIKVDPNEVEVGQIIMVKAGERVPLDAKVMEGNSMLDTSALTGESIPQQIETGDEILSGCINISGVLIAKVTKEFEESTVNKILDLVENASSRKSHSEQFITKFARYYTPIVVIVAGVLAIIPPLVMKGATFSKWIYRALSFLVVSCPCALVISIPLSFFGGIGGASKKGILVKGSNYLEALANAEIVVFDKTGTLTKGVFTVQEIQPVEISKEELLELAVYAESYSNHPISLSLKRAYKKEIDYGRISDVEEIAGYGVKAVVDGKQILAGNEKLMKKMNISFLREDFVETVVHIAVDNQYEGYILIADEIKKDSFEAIKNLKAIGIKQTIMLTGDTKNIGHKISKDLGIDKVYAELLPGDKVEKLEELFSLRSLKGKLVFVGDGINDAPVLARADIGIAMGGLGSDAAIEAADVVIMTDEPSKIATAIKISKKTLRIANQNIIFAIGVKIIVLILSALGFTSMWAAIFADVGVAILAIFNSFRALNVKYIQ